MDKIKTTHVGSLPRSSELSDLLFKKDKQEKIDVSNFDEIVKRDVKKIVEKQINLGIDFISDGEMSKISYATYVKDRIDGFSGESERKAPQDLDDFPSFKERIARSGGTPTYTRPCCTHELKIKDTLSLTKDIDNFKSALEENNHKQAFMNAASPGVISAFLPNKFYKDDDDYLNALSNIMTTEYEEIVSNDIYLQLDCPDLALARHMTFKDLSEVEFLKRAEKQIEFLNHSIKNILSDIKFKVEHVGYLDEPNRNPRASIRWSLEGVHSEDSKNYGEKTNSNLTIIGINHAELNSYGIIKEWVLFDEVAIWKQILMNKNKNG